LVSSLSADDKQIARFAKDVIVEHGDAVIVQADHHRQAWEIIREVIRDLPGPDFKKGLT
jgi:hypothetical protein